MIQPHSPGDESSLTSRAIAYLKAEVPEDDPEPVIKLSASESPVLRILNNGLLVAYLVDIGDCFEWVQERDLDNDDIDAKRLHEIGIGNLARLATKARVSVYGNIFAVFLDGNFEASLILLDELWDGMFRQFVSGDYAVAIPARDILAFCDAASAVGVAELQAVIDRLKQTGADHPITNTIYIRRGGEWHPR